MDLWLVLIIIDWTLFILTAGTVLYLGIFSIFSLFNKSHEITKAKLQRRFIVLIPSYKQDSVIEHTVLSILGQSYPQRMFDIMVISDQMVYICLNTAMLFGEKRLGMQLLNG